MGEHKNTIIAIALSLVVMVGWQIFIAYPQMEKQRQQDALKQQEQSQAQRDQVQQGQTQPGSAEREHCDAANPGRAERVGAVASGLA
jgi:YidC/Oxa1 family membrane protein insertase